MLRLYDTCPSSKKKKSVQHLSQFFFFSFNELSHLLLNLVETCNFLSKKSQTRWKDTLGDIIDMKTQLIITDKGRLPHEEDIREANEIGFTKRVYHIIAYYIENII